MLSGSVGRRPIRFLSAAKLFDRPHLILRRPPQRPAIDALDGVTLAVIARTAHFLVGASLIPRRPPTSGSRVPVRQTVGLPSLRQVYRDFHKVCDLKTILEALR